MRADYAPARVQEAHTGVEGSALDRGPATCSARTTLRGQVSSPSTETRGRSRHRLLGQGALTRVLSNVATLTTKPCRCSESSSNAAADAPWPAEIQELGRTIRARFDKMGNFHLARVWLQRIRMAMTRLRERNGFIVTV